MLQTDRNALHGEKVRAFGRRGQNLRAPSMRGFSMIELMVTLAVLSTIAAAAFIGVRQDEYKNQYRRFVDDVEGALVTARNFAIDEQTRVRVDLDSSSITVTQFDVATSTWSLVDRKSLASAQTTLLNDAQVVCIYGMMSGVQTPAQAVDLSPPSSCLSGTQRLQFEPDGRFTDPSGAFMTDAGAGVSVWIANRQIASSIKLAVIELWPGGLIRTYRDQEVE